jgi:hypothetical protein
MKGGASVAKIRDYFVQHPDGSWEPRQPVTIQGPTGQISLNPGVRFRRGVLFMGVDVAKLCEEGAEI